MARTARGRETREAFRDGARHVIGEKGFLRTTISEIAEAAGRSPASFYNYYDSKEDLLEELAEEFRQDTLQRAQPAYKSGTPVWEVMVESSRAYWMSYREHLRRTGRRVPDGDGRRALRRAVAGDPRRRHRDDPRGHRAGAGRGLLPGHRSVADGHCPRFDVRALLLRVTRPGRSVLRPAPSTTRAAIRTIASIWYHAVYWKAPGVPGSPRI